VNGPRPNVYVAPTRRVVAGAVFLHVPVPYAPEVPLATSTVSAGLLQIERDFERAWQTASPRIREVGVLTLAPTKPRPVVVVAVGATEEDTWHREKVWVAPWYTHKDYQVRRHGRNIFNLPAAPEFGLDDDGFLDFFQLVSLPVGYLWPHFHRCDLSPAAFDALVTAFQACLILK
jgi:hypothetical protein